MSKVPPILTLAFVLAFSATGLQAAKTLDIYFIDVEGGQSTLIVSPSGQSLLVDTGYAGNSGRDALRILQAAKAAGIKKIDYLLTTHFHFDHVGGIDNLVSRVSVGTFLDHGPSVEEVDGKNGYPIPYEKAIASGQHTVVAPGDKIAVKGLDITVLTSAGKHLERRDANANPFCDGIKPEEGETGENPQSAGVVVEFGKFRFADPGDIIFNEELALECPNNQVGKVDLYLTAHHGTHLSPKSVYALAPRVIVMNNGAKKGGLAAEWQLLRDMPGLEDLWQLHFAVAGSKETNSPDLMIANVEDVDEGKYLKVSAAADGSFTVYNSRNKYMKHYGAK